MNFRCPVCMYPALPYPPSNYHICPCCGTEFGNDDAVKTHAELRGEWFRNGAHWFFGNQPRNWNAWKQLIDAGHAEVFPHIEVQNVPPPNEIFTVWAGRNQLVPEFA